MIPNFAIIYKTRKSNFSLYILSLRKIQSKTVELFYLIKNKKNDLEIARVKTGMVCYDHVNKKIKKLPIKFSTHFNN